MSRMAPGRQPRTLNAGRGINVMPFFPRTAATAVPAAAQNWSSEPRQHGAMSYQETFRKQRRPRRPPQPLFMSESIYHQLQYRNKLLQQRLDVNDERYGHEIPTVIHRNRFHSLFPLDDPNYASTSKTFYGFPTSVYKATRTKSNEHVCLLRFQGCLVANDVSSSTLEPWTRLRGHPNLVGVQEVFLCRDFGGAGDICFIYDYYPGAVSLFHHYIEGGLEMSLDLLWSIICQLVSALSSVHAVGLACRIIDARRILLPVKGTARIRINCCGVKDIVRFGACSIEESQSHDILAVGLLALHLIMRRPVDEVSAPSAIAYVDSQYSPEIASVLHLMVLHHDSAGKRPTIYDVSQAIHHRIVRELQFAHSESDSLYVDLAAEAQNGRLFRLLAKLLFINERPEFDNDPQWSEHGDRYPIKLFRDFVFHQVDNNGNPVINLAQVIHWLNKLDAGVPEKMMLSNRDLSSLVVLGYDDLKRFIDTAFTELMTKKKLPEPAQVESGSFDRQAMSSTTDSQPITRLNVNAPDFILN